MMIESGGGESENPLRQQQHKAQQMVSSPASPSSSPPVRKVLNRISSSCHQSSFNNNISIPNDPDFQSSPEGSTLVPNSKSSSTSSSAHPIPKVPPKVKPRLFRQAASVMTEAFQDTSKFPSSRRSSESSHSNQRVLQKINRTEPTGTNNSEFNSDDNPPAATPEVLEMNPLKSRSDGPQAILEHPMTTAAEETIADDRSTVNTPYSPKHQLHAATGSHGSPDVTGTNTSQHDHNSISGGGSKHNSFSTSTFLSSFSASIKERFSYSRSSSRDTTVSQQQSSERIMSGSDRKLSNSLNNEHSMSTPSSYHQNSSSYGNKRDAESLPATPKSLTAFSSEASGDIFATSSPVLQTRISNSKKVMQKGSKNSSHRVLETRIDIINDDQNISDERAPNYQHNSCSSPTDKRKKSSSPGTSPLHHYNTASNGNQKKTSISSSSASNTPVEKRRGIPSTSGSSSRLKNKAISLMKLHMPSASVTRAKSVDTDSSPHHKRNPSVQNNLINSSTSDDRKHASSLSSITNKCLSETKLTPVPESTSSGDATDNNHNENFDAKNIFGIHIHNTDRKLKSCKLVLHPVIKVHVVDIKTGRYLSKKHPKQNVVSYYENRNRTEIDYILPIMTQPCDLVKYIRYPRAPIWEELLLYNEDYDHFIKPEVIIFFEVLDFLSLDGLDVRIKKSGSSGSILTSSSSERTGTGGKTGAGVPPSALAVKKNTVWWNRVAWAFLRIVGGDGRHHVGKKLRLQLFKPVSIKMNGLISPDSNQTSSALNSTELFNWWAEERKIPFPASIYITVKAIPVTQSDFTDVKPSLRSLLPFQPEESASINIRSSNSQNITESSLLSSKSLNPQTTIIRPSSASSTTNNRTGGHFWSRVEGQPCKIPKNPWQEFSAGNNRSCYSLKFSNDGMKLACGASVFAAYLSAEKRSTVFIYELPSGNFLTRVNGFHLGTIYDIDWSINDKYIMSASNDCTAQIWSISKDSDVRTSSDRTSGSPSTSNKNVFSSVILPHPCFIYSCKFCPQIELQYMIFTGAFDGIIRIWSVKNCFEPHSSYSRDPELLREIDGHQGHVLSLAFKMFPSTISTSPSLSSSVEPTVPHLITSNDQQTTKHWAKLTLFSSGSNGSITLWRHTDDGTGSDPSNWMSVSRIRIPELKNVPINCIKMSPSGSKILLCCRDGLLRMIDFDLELVIRKYPGSMNFSHLIRGSISPCGKYVFMGSEDGLVHVWHADTGEKVHTYENLPFKGPVTCVEYHPFDHVIGMCGLGGRTVSVSLFKYNYFPPDKQRTLDGSKDQESSVVIPVPTKRLRPPLRKSQTVDHSSRGVPAAGVSTSGGVTGAEVSGTSSRMMKAMKKLEVALKMKSFDQS